LHAHDLLTLSLADALHREIDSIGNGEADADTAGDAKVEPLPPSLGVAEYSLTAGSA
jgi:hypothetical protein